MPDETKVSVPNLYLPQRLVDEITLEQQRQNRLYGNDTSRSEVIEAFLWKGLHRG